MPKNYKKKKSGTNITINPEDQYKDNSFTIAEILALKNMLAREQSDGENNYLTQVKANADVSNDFITLKNMFPFIISTIDLLRQKIKQNINMKKTSKKGGMERHDEEDSPANFIPLFQEEDEEFDEPNPIVPEKKSSKRKVTKPKKYEGFLPEEDDDEIVHEVQKKPRGRPKTKKLKNLKSLYLKKQKNLK